MYAFRVSHLDARRNHRIRAKDILPRPDIHRSTPLGMAYQNVPMGAQQLIPRYLNNTLRDIHDTTNEQQRAAPANPSSPKRLTL